MLKSGTFVERRTRAIPGLLGLAVLLAAAVLSVALAEDNFGPVILVIMSLALFANQARRVIRPFRLVITNDGIFEQGPQPANRLEITSWSDIGAVSTVETDHVHFLLLQTGRSKTLHSYGLRAPMLAALMNDLRLDGSAFHGTEEAANRAKVSAGELYLADNQPEMLRHIAPIDPSLAIPPEATGDFLLIGRTPMNHEQLVHSSGDRLTKALVGGVEQDVYIHLGETRLTVIAFIQDGGDSYACAPLGAELASSFWAAYHACDGHFETL